jgi:outer membrane protein assembly factor BamB
MHREATPALRRLSGKSARTLVTLMCVGCAGTVHGTVFIDLNGDGIREADEPGAANIVVAVDHDFGKTNSKGEFTIDTPTPGAIVWASSPGQYRPGPAWARASDEHPEIPLVPLAADVAASPLTFVVAADSHTTADPSDPWDGGDLEDAIDQATSLPEPPRFFTIVGDITQSSKDDQVARVVSALTVTTVPWVSVPGNHDAFDGGAAYRARFGPDNYSFDVGTLHVIVWDTNLSDDDQLAFVAADVAHVPPDMTIVGLAHSSPTDAVADHLASLGVMYLFTGHWHANRRVAREGLVEWGTQAFVMGGIDQSPAGYRIVTFNDGAPTVEHRERLVHGHLDAVFPQAGSCAPAGGFALLAAAALDAAVPSVTARIDCGMPIALAPRGGWVYGGDVPALPPGSHTLELQATSPGGRQLSAKLSFEVCDPPAAPSIGEWPQVGGGPDHVGMVEAAIAPPLQVAWATPIGGTLALGTPVIAGDTVIVASTDRAAGDAGGLTALDLANGRIRWRVTTPFPVTAAPAVDRDVVIATLGDGEVRAYALTDGTTLWQRSITQGVDSLAAALWAPPTIADGVVFAGVQGRFAALDVATGEPSWTTDQHPAEPWLGSLGAPAVSDDVVLASFGRDDGVTAFRASTGERLWQTTDVVAVNAAPVIVNGTAFVASESGSMIALDVATGIRRWTTSIFSGEDWSYAITAAPAYADGRLFVPTQWNAVVALDAATGAELWRVTTPGGPLELAHYRSAQPGFAASPVVTGDIVWIGRPDGALVALATKDGHELWSTQLGAPMISAPAPAGNGLVVATYDGTVRVLVPTAVREPPPHRAVPAVCLPPLPLEERLARVAPRPTGAGCCDAGGAPSGPLAIAVVVMLVCRRRR